MSNLSYLQVIKFLKDNEKKIFRDQISSFCFLENNGIGRNNMNIPIRLFFYSEKVLNIAVRYGLHPDNKNKIWQEYKKLKFLNSKFSPHPYYFSPKEKNSLKKDILVLEYIDGLLLKARFLAFPEIKILAEELSKLHKFTFNKFSLDLEFPPSQSGGSSLIALRKIDHLEKYFLKHSLSHKQKILSMFNEIKGNLINNISKFKDEGNSFIHGDLRNHFVKTGNNFYLLDWELSRVGDLAEDLAHFIYFSKLPQNFKKYFLKQYFKFTNRNKDDILRKINFYLIIEEFSGLAWCWEQMLIRSKQNEKFYYRNLFEMRYRNLINSFRLFGDKNYILLASHLYFYGQ